MTEEQAEPYREDVGNRMLVIHKSWSMTFPFDIITRYSTSLMCYFLELHGADALVCCAHEALI